MSGDATNEPAVGILEWFRPGEHERVLNVLDDLDALGVRHLRTGVSWADWHAAEGRPWYEWLMPTLAARVDLLPCLTYTPPSIGEFAGTNAPPKRLEDYGDWAGQIIDLFGEHFEWAELWNEPDNHREWNAGFDPGYDKFARMVGAAARLCRGRGKRTLLGGLANADPNFLSRMHDLGALEHFDAVGVHGFPFSFEFYWEGWATRVGRLKERLDWCGRGDLPVWITETGYSTWRHDGRKQVNTFLDAVAAPADRVYWYAAADLDPELPTVDGFHSDEREYHFGLRTGDGRDKLLARLWKQGGIPNVRRHADLLRNRDAKPKQYALVTGGCGFVGTNLADRLATGGRDVLCYDDLSRPGVEENAASLKEKHGNRVRIECADVRDEHALRDAVRGASAIWHLAAQVAVTCSLDRPMHDFEVNARGTLNLLEAVRRRGNDAPPVVFTSTNKVYGDLADVDLQLEDGRWQPAAADLRRRGVDEDRPLDFHSPYGVSKGAADQYVLDYARGFDLPAVVLRMSCIYGPHQHGNADQGWVAHFARAALNGEPVTLYGDGRQVRDVLYVGDLVEALLLAERRIAAVRGGAFNLGGGPGNAVSLRDVLGLLGGRVGRPIDFDLGPWRPGDQRWYVSDPAAFAARLDWRPTVGVDDGLGRLLDWLRDRQETRRVGFSPPSARQTVG